MIRVERVAGCELACPKRETEGAAGYDLRADIPARELCLMPGEFTLIRTGFKWAIPPGWAGLIRDRSGHASKYRLTTRAGLIDEDFRGEVRVLMVNESKEPQTIKKGERIAQMIVVPYHPMLQVVDSLEETERGAGGYGSTGET